jgi:hypothetical protein
VSTNSITYQDASGVEWDTEQLQALVLQVRKFDLVASRLGKPRHEVTKKLREMGVMSPPELTRHLAQMDTNQFRDLIIREGGPDKAAKYLGVSITHLRNVMTEVGIEWRKKSLTPESAAAALDRFGSVILAARLLDTTPAEIKKCLPDWRERRDPLKTGRQAVATGRTGELFWRDLRTDNTLESPCLENPNSPGYDFVDREYKKVNVKTANPEKQKNKDIWTWTWEVNPQQDADTFPLVMLDRNCQPCAFFLITRNENRELVIPLGLRAVDWANGAKGISFKASNDRPNLLEVVNEE